MNKKHNRVTSNEIHENYLSDNVNSRLSNIQTIQNQNRSTIQEIMPVMYGDNKYQE